ncbi:apolipoprotein acyltransferase [Paracoccus sp. p4-l81]|uniref:apolipoprotein acyltransferase n=1 Tax=unclassified Paracoccus (in: a-proteobacteria) TaxID=2688777 RepID=UPI0035BA3076
MIILAGLLIGAIVGATRARRLRGTGADVAQYAIAHAIAFALIGVGVTVLIDRLAG